MLEIIICLFCGLPGTGKTSVCSKVQQIDKVNAYFHVEYDSLIGKITDFYNASWKKRRNQVHQFLEEIVQNLKNDSEIKKNEWNLLDPNEVAKIYKNIDKVVKSKKYKKVCILVDDNMFLKSMRKIYLQTAIKHQICYFQVYFEGNFELCRERLTKRTTNIVDDITWLKMHSQFEVPNLTNFQVVLQSTCELIECANKIILSINKQQPIKKLEKQLKQQLFADNSRQINTLNTAHQCDLILRKVIKSLFSSSDIRIKNLIMMIPKNDISKAKKYILSEIKSGQYFLSGCKEENIENKLRQSLINILQNY